MPYLREKYGMEIVTLYGSSSRFEQVEKSDVDVLVELSRPLGFEFVELADYLQNILGRKVDLATFSTFNRSKKDPCRRRLQFSIL